MKTTIGHIFIKDNLEVLRALDSESVDLIYLDPPFQSNRNYSSPLGSQAAGAHFKDTWMLSDTDRAWHGQIAEHHPALFDIIRAIGKANGDKAKSYLIYMAMRLLEMHRVLKDTGSIYLHCDQTMSHSLKLVMDSIFGKTNFRNEVVWCYTGNQNTTKHFKKKHDSLLFYSKTKNFVFNNFYTPYKEATLNRYNHKDSKGRYKLNKYGGKMVKKYMSSKGLGVYDYWIIPAVIGGSKESNGYPTQKPVALLERIIKASSNEGDLVLDPFCGSGTTCVAAEKLNRKWIGIDLSEKAVETANKRLKGS